MAAPWDTQVGLWLWSIDALDWEKITLDDIIERLDSGGNYSKRYAYNSDSLLEYLGIADPGSSTASAVWKIIKMEYSNNLMTSYLFANGSRKFLHIWDNRETYTYS